MSHTRAFGGKLVSKKSALGDSEREKWKSKAEVDFPTLESFQPMLSVLSLKFREIPKEVNSYESFLLLEWQKQLEIKAKWTKKQPAKSACDKVKTKVQGEIKTLLEKNTGIVSARVPKTKDDIQGVSTSEVCIFAFSHLFGH